MYRAEKPVQTTFEDFNRSCGMKLDVRDEWIVVANGIDWAAVEEKCMEFFPSRRGRPALNARTAPGALIIQHRAKLSDRDPVKGAPATPTASVSPGLGAAGQSARSGMASFPDCAGASGWTS